MSEPESSPAAVRLGEELRQLRIAAGYPSIQALAARIDGYGESLIAKVEQGRRTASRQLFPAWLDACAVHIETKAPVLTDGHRRALTALWEIGLQREGPIPEFFERYAAAEEKAAFLRMWGLLLIPGPLQTREYAHAMFLGGRLDEDEATERAEARMKRRARIDGPDAAHVTAIIFESALHCLVGTPEIMVGQLEDLLQLLQRRNVIIQVIPDAGYFLGYEGQFQIASGPGILDTVDMETVEDHVSDDPATARKVAELFEEIRSYALNAAESRALIQEAVRRWSQQQ
jgi:transcriptional regulator with XRE-family HTH domain